MKGAKDGRIGTKTAGGVGGDGQSKYGNTGAMGCLYHVAQGARDRVEHILSVGTRSAKDGWE